MTSVLIVTERFWPEDFIINDLAAELAAGGVEVTVLTQQPSYPHGQLFQGYRNRPFTRETWQGVTVLRLGSVLGYRNSLMRKILSYLWFALYGAFTVLVRRLRFDSVLIYQVGPLTMAVPGILAGKVRRRPVVIWTQDLWPDSVYAYGFRKSRALNWILDVFVRRVYRAVDTILFSCRGFRPSLAAYSTKPLFYAPNWPLFPYLPGRQVRDPSAPPVFLFAGNLGKVQNLENVIRGFARAFGKVPAEARLRLVGDGSAAETLRQLAAQEGVPVEFPGRKSAVAMVEEYDRADFLILSLADQPVLRLTIPSKFQMYLRVGKPILCAAAGEVAVAVQTAGVGLLADPAAPADIARAFRALSTSGSEERRRWSANAGTTLKGEFNRETIIESIRRVLEPQ
jgi:glycosyltransferase involved in cell wall biosynthesis